MSSDLYVVFGYGIVVNEEQICNHANFNGDASEFFEDLLANTSFRFASLGFIDDANYGIFLYNPNCSFYGGGYDLIDTIQRPSMAEINDFKDFIHLKLNIECEPTWISGASYD